MGFLLVAKYIPLANRGLRLLANREKNEKAVTGHSRGISSEKPGTDDQAAMAGKPGPAGRIFLQQFYFEFYYPNCNGGCA